MASTLNSSFELSRRLVEAGHDVTFLSHLDLAKAVGKQGHSFRQLTGCREQITEFSKELESLKANGNATFWRKLVLGRQYRKKTIRTGEIEEVLGDLKADLIIADIEMHYAILACLSLKIPIVSVIVWFSIFRISGLPPMHTPIQPGTRLGESLKIKMAWWKLVGRRLVFNVLKIFQPSSIKRRFIPVGYETNRRADLKAIAKAHGVEFSKATDQTQWLKPHLYREIPVLSFNVFEFEFPHVQHPNLTYVGPMIHSKRVESKMNPEEQKQWMAFLKNVKSDQSSRLVYCSLGTFWSTDQSFLQKLIELFREQPDWNLVIGLGGKSSKRDLQPVPENVLVMDYAPQLEILQHADAAITHGGITSINECIDQAVPMLVCSTGHVDQDGCAARVKFHRLGIVAEIDSEVSKLKTDIDKLLNDKEIRDNVEQMKGVFEKYKADKVALKMIEGAIR